MAEYREKKGRGNRTSDAEYKRRIDETEKLIVSGVHRRTVIRLAKDRFGVSRRTAARYVAAAFNRFREDAELESKKTTADRRAEHEATLRSILTRGVQEGNLRVQLQVVQTLMALHGTESRSSRVELSGPDGGRLRYEKMSDAELLQLAGEAFVPDLKVVKN